jgi:hypothetical protein
LFLASIFRIFPRIATAAVDLSGSRDAPREALQTAEH